MAGRNPGTSRGIPTYLDQDNGSFYEYQLGLWLMHPYNVVNIVLAPLYGQNEHYGAEF